MILYRQHRSNAIGLARSPIRRLSRVLHRGPVAFVGQFKAHVAALQRQRHLLSAASRRELDVIVRALEAGPMACAALVRSGRLRRQTWPETIFLTFWLCLGISVGDIARSHEPARRDVIAPLQ